MKKNLLILVLFISTITLLTTCKKEDSGSLPIAGFIATPTTGTAPLHVNFKDESTNNTTSWQWNFGDGNISSLKNPEHTYENAGTYNVHLTAVNSHGSNTIVKSSYIIVNVTGVAPEAAFTSAPNSGTAPLTVNFTDQSTNSPTNWIWSFGDGNGSTQQNPVYTYQNPGLYTVQLIVSNSYGNDSVIIADCIDVNPAGVAPVAEFTGSPASGRAPHTVNFSDESTNNPATWQWDFGDGSSSTLQNPVHTYLYAGTYVVKLVVSNNYGSATLEKENYINVSASGGTGTMTDGDGTIYQTIIIGDQEWMAENLRYLPAVSWPESGSASFPYYYVSGYDGTDLTEAKATANYINYGVLYNWTAAKNACPAGWHLPDNTEWTELINYLEGYNIAGGKLKETDSVFWASPNTGATNEYGFSARPGGLRDFYGSYSGLGRYGYWWSSTESIPDYAWYMHMSFDNIMVNSLNYYKTLGMSVRCVKD